MHWDRKGRQKGNSEKSLKQQKAKQNRDNYTYTILSYTYPITVHYYTILYLSYNNHTYTILSYTILYLSYKYTDTILSYTILYLFFIFIIFHLPVTLKNLTSVTS